MTHVRLLVVDYTVKDFCSLKKELLLGFSWSRQREPKLEQWMDSGEEEQRLWEPSMESLSPPQRH